MITDLNIKLEEYINIKPYPHYYQDNILDYDFAKQLQEEILNIPIEKFDRYDNPFETKLTLRDKFNYPELLSKLFNFLETKEFIQKLSNICGYKLIKDENRNFNGVHIYKNGEKLDIHLDAEVHPKTKDFKILTLGIYLSYNWSENYGCNLEIWNGDNWKEKDYKLYNCEKKIAPLFNRLILFTNTNNSWHGNPEAVNSYDNNSKRIFITISYLTLNENKNDNYREKALFIRRPEDEYDEKKEELIKIRANSQLYKDIYIYSNLHK